MRITIESFTTMYQLDIITKIHEPKPDGVIRIRPGESAFVQIEADISASSTPEILGRPVGLEEKTIPALIIAVSEDPGEILRVFQIPQDPEDTVPFLAISPDRNALLTCRAEGKILSRITADYPDVISEPMRYLHEIIRKTEFCIILCSRTYPEGNHLVGEMAQFSREQNTLTILSVIGGGEPDFPEDVSDILGKFHAIILNSDYSNSIPFASLERIRDLCEATINDVVTSGGRHALVPNDRLVVRELLLHGGISNSGWHTAGIPDAHEFIRWYVQSIQGNSHPDVAGTYSILKIPWESTMDAATQFRDSLVDILNDKVRSRYPHQMRIDGYYPETDGHFELSIWTFSGNYKIL